MAIEVAAETPRVDAAKLESGGRWTCLDGNEAAARIAYLLSELIAIYPITPASPMGELADSWSATGEPNLWGTVPEVVEMQSEAGAAGAVHGGLLAGTLATTFTASQGLLLMLPNMFKIAGELTPAVIHVAARALATHALSIFGDHSDVMAARTTGWAMLASSSVQEAQDMALVAHLATLECRVPFLHFFDGFRTSHEINKIQLIDKADIEALINRDAISAHRARGLDPDHPVLRGSAQNPDVFFQAREAVNPFYAAVPAVAQAVMDRVATQIGRNYSLVEYEGSPDADRVLVVMGSAAGPIEETVAELRSRGERVGVVKIRLFRPFPIDAFVDALPASTRSLAVLDRTKEPGATGEPLYQDVVTALAIAAAERSTPNSKMPRVIGGRYGLSSKEFTPSMVKGIFEELSVADPKRSFTVGIVDDVTDTHLDVDPGFSTDRASVRAVFYGLGSDGTVGASKSTVKIAGATDLYAQGYSVYDSKKSGSMTISHVRLDTAPIASTYLISNANFVACHQFTLLHRVDVLQVAEHGATFLLNSPFSAEEVWDHLPPNVCKEIQDKELQFYVIDAHRLAKELKLGARINTIMQSCFFSLSKVLPEYSAIAELKASAEHAYNKRGSEVVARNQRAIDLAPRSVHRVPVPTTPAEPPVLGSMVGEPPGEFVTRVTKQMMAGRGDLLPVSALPVDGTFPTGTSRWEKRCIAQEIPIWDPDICIDCGHCVIVCPHAAIRMNVFDPGFLESAPEGFATKTFRSKELEDHQLTIQVLPDDCTGCGVCVDVCPVTSKQQQGRKALNMEPIGEHLERERSNSEYFSTIPLLDRSLLDPATVKGSQVREPLFEFPGACAGCGETPYLKLLSQLFGDRLVVANATGCSSIFGGNLPTTPWSVDAAGRGPAWANSLFEDNAEFGLGIRLAVDKLTERAGDLLRTLADDVGSDLAADLLAPHEETDGEIAAQRERIALLRARLQLLLDGEANRKAEELSSLADLFVQRSLWIVGGDGWAYDIGYGGLDHVLAAGHNVNILVLDTEVYSNTGGQASKATPRGAVAKFASKGKGGMKKDLGLIAASYGDVYVAQIALGADYNQTIKAFLEAEAWPGPSLIIAYSTCIAHGIEMSCSMSHQKDAVRSGYWPLYRYHPGKSEHEHPFQLDSRAPSMPLEDFVSSETRFATLARSSPRRAQRLLELAQQDVDQRWQLYEQMSDVERKMPEADGQIDDSPTHS